MDGSFAGTVPCISYSGRSAGTPAASVVPRGGESQLSSTDEPPRTWPAYVSPTASRSHALKSESETTREMKSESFCAFMDRECTQMAAAFHPKQHGRRKFDVRMTRR